MDWHIDIFFWYRGGAVVFPAYASAIKGCFFFFLHFLFRKCLFPNANEKWSKHYVAFPCYYESAIYPWMCVVRPNTTQHSCRACTMLFVDGFVDVIELHSLQPHSYSQYTWKSPKCDIVNEYPVGKSIGKSLEFQTMFLWKWSNLFPTLNYFLTGLDIRCTVWNKTSNLWTNQNCQKLVWNWK